MQKLSKFCLLISTALLLIFFAPALIRKYNAAFAVSLKELNVLWIIIMVLIIASILINWNYLLHRKVKKKTIDMSRIIEALKISEEKYRELSIHDKLTGLFNRAYFENEIQCMFNVELSSLGLVICDLDGLKLINDSLGHTAGDEYLINAAKIFLASFRENDRIARIGGDEFAIIMPNTTEEEIKKFCNQLKNNIESFNRLNASIPLSISFGYSFQNSNEALLDEMLKEADNYMYRKKLHRRQSIKSDIVQALKTLLKERDFITEGHAERVQELACILAEVVGVQENEIADIKLLAQFHDIGKVGISDNVLLKRGSLTEDEKREIQRHAEIGARIAESSQELVPIADGILKHHEWWNGQGYPMGLEGDQIPLQARIIAIVDAYDAMVNDRPYRSAMSEQEAIKELKRGAKLQFDPYLVDKFVNIIAREDWETA